MDNGRKPNVDKKDEDDQEQPKKKSEKSESSATLSVPDRRSRSPSPRLLEIEGSAALSVPDQRSRSPSPQLPSSRSPSPRFPPSRSPSPRLESSRSPSPRSPGKVISNFLKSMAGKTSNRLSAEGEPGPSRSPSPKKQKDFETRYLVSKPKSPTPSEESCDTVSTSLSGSSGSSASQFNLLSQARMRALKRTSSADNPSVEVSSAKRSTSVPPRRPEVDLLTGDHSHPAVDITGGPSRDVKEKEENPTETPTSEETQSADSRDPGSATLEPRQEIRGEGSAMVLPPISMDVLEDDAEAGSSAPPSKDTTEKKREPMCKKSD